MQQEELQHLEDFTWFAIVVDGEFCGKIGMGKNPTAELAGLMSDPTIIELNQEQVKKVTLGWVYDGTTFVPSEQ